MQNKRFGAWSSSTNPEEISSTVESVVKLLAFLISGVGAIKGLNWAVDAKQIDNLSSGLTALVIACLTIWQTSQALWFGVRRIFYKVYPPLPA